MKSSTPIMASAAKQTQTGFSLLEISVALMLLAAVTLGYLYNRSHQSAVSLARTQAGYYQMVSAAVSQYMTSNYNSLKTKDNTCSVVPLTTDSSAPPTFSACNIDVVLVSGTTSSVKSIANGMQPSLSELSQAGYLPANFSNGFLWPTAQVMKTNGTDFAAPELRVQIQRWCNGEVSSASNICDLPELRSLVYNAQPFAQESTSGVIDLTRMDKLLEARSYLGAYGLIAYDHILRKDGDLYSEGDKFKLPNPLRFSSGSQAGLGLEGVLALQGRYQWAQGVAPVDPPTPPPPPIDDRVVKALPFSECDPKTDAQTVAYASLGVSRVAPVPDINFSDGMKYCKYINSYSIDYVHFPTFQGSAMTCRRNEPATNYMANCPPPPEWRTCVTALKVPNTTTPYPSRPWVRREAHDPSKKEYCWQPVTESYFGRNGRDYYDYSPSYSVWDIKEIFDKARFYNPGRDGPLWIRNISKPELP
jgi:prepilin-type N-terminal cleavage/methylation domain-containing protein